MSRRHSAEKREIIPDAKYDDGRLDVLVASPRTTRDWARLIARVLARQQRPEELHLRQAQRPGDRATGLDRGEHAFQQDHAGDQRSPREVPGQAGIVVRDLEMHPPRITGLRAAAGAGGGLCVQRSRSRQNAGPSAAMRRAKSKALR